MTDHKSLAVSAEQAEHDAVYRKILWRIMPFLVVCYVCAFIDRTNIGFAKLEFLRDLKLTDAQYGIGAGIFYLGYMLFEIPSNLYLAARGARRTLLRIMVLWGLCVTVTAFMRTAGEFYFLRALLGAAEAGFFPGILLYLTYWIPVRRRARATSIFMFSITISGIVGGPLSGAIMHTFGGLYGLSGWQWLFIVEGLPSSLLGIAAYYYLTDRPRDAHWLTESERAIVENDLAAERERAKATSHHSVGAALRDPRLYLLALMAYGLFGSTGGVFLWLPTILKTAGAKSLWTIGLLSAIPFLAGAIAQFANGRHSDRTMERRLHAAIPALVAAAGWAILPSVSTSVPLAVFVLTIVASSTLAAMSPFWTMPSSLLAGTAAAAGIAVVSSVGSAGNLISPIVVGWIASATGTLAAGQYYLAAITAIGAIALLGVKPRAATAAGGTR